MPELPATRRLIVALSVLVLLAVLAAGPWRTNENLRAAGDRTAARDAAQAAQVAQLRAELDDRAAELADLLTRLRAGVDGLDPAGLPAGELADLDRTLDAALAALRRPPAAPPAQTPAASTPPGPDPRPAPAARPRPAPATPPAPPAPPAPPNRPACFVRLVNVCVERAPLGEVNSQERPSERLGSALHRTHQSDKSADPGT